MASLSSYVGSNPWRYDEEKRFGNTSKLFSIAKDLGYQLDSAEDRQRQLTSLNNFDSIQCLSLMSDISTSEDRLYQVTRENTRIEMDRETDDITNLTKLESKIAALASLSTHLSEVCGQQALITKRLQTPIDKENLQIDASLHKYVTGFFTDISPMLSDLGSLLETLTWTTENSLSFGRKTAAVLAQLNGTLEKVQCDTDKITNLRADISSLQQSLTHRR